MSERCRHGLVRCDHCGRPHVRVPLVTDRITVEVRQHDWIPGFAAYLSGSVLEGPAHVVLNVGAFMASIEAGDIAADEVPYLVAESLMHEVMHALEDWAGVEFSEDRIEALLTKYRKSALPEEGA